MKKILLLALLSLSIIGCKKDTTEEETQIDTQLSEDIETFEALKKEAMTVHDEVMPLGSELASLKDQLIQKDSTNTEFQAAVQQLDQAHDDMMAWMRSYSEKFPYGSETPATRKAMDDQLPVLKEEVAEIKKLKQQTKDAIGNAKVTLDPGLRL